MKVLADRKIKFLFSKVLAVAGGFTLLSAVLVAIKIENAAFCVWILSLCMAVLILVFVYGYFYVEHRIMDNSVSQITEFIAEIKMRVLNVMMKEN